MFTPFIGREKNLTELDALAARERIVSLIGPGGIGKTRLAREWLGDRRFVFCDLTHAEAVTDVQHALASALGVTLLDTNILPTLAFAVRGQLIVFNNAETVSAALCDLLDFLFEEAPDARFLLTSRQAIGAKAEVSCRVEPLADADACALFLAAARQHDKDFSLTESETQALPVLVSLLGGLPLALELGAARTSVLSVSALAAHLQKPGGEALLRAKTPGRHESIERVVEDTWQSLSKGELRVLAYCTVFSGERDLEAIEAVAGGDALVNVIEALCEYGLLSSEKIDARHVFRIHPLIAQRAAVHLRGAGEESGARLRHARYFVAKEAMAFTELLSIVRHAPKEAASERVRAALRLHPELRVHGPPELHKEVLGVALALVCSDQERAELLLAQIDCALVGGQAMAAFGLLSELEALPVVAERAALRGAKNARMGKALRDTGQYDACIATFRRARPDVESAGDVTALVDLLMDLGYWGGEIQTLYEALTLAEQNQLARERVEVLLYLAVLHGERCEDAQAREMVGKCVAATRSIGDPRNRVLILTNCASASMMYGDFAEARALLDEAQALAKKVGNRFYDALAVNYLAIIGVIEGDVTPHLGALSYALGYAREAGNMILAGCSLHVSAIAMTALGDDAAAAALLEEAHVFTGVFPEAQGIALEALEITAQLVKAQRLEASDSVGAKKLRMEATGRVRHYPTPGRESRAKHGRTTELRLGAACMKRYLQPRSNEQRREVVTVRRPGPIFVFADGRRIDLTKKSTLRQLIGVLLMQHEKAPGVAVSASQLMDEVWPDVKARETLPNRLYVAIAKLREMGIGDLLAHDGEGYFFHSRYAVAFED